MKKTGTIVFILVVIAALLWIVFGNKGKSNVVKRLESSDLSNSTGNQSVQPKTTTKISRNTEGNALLLITTNESGATSTRSLTFTEATNLVGTANKVCSMAKYEECSRIRM